MDLWFRANRYTYVNSFLYDRYLQRLLSNIPWSEAGSHLFLSMVITMAMCLKDIEIYFCLPKIHMNFCQKDSTAYSCHVLFYEGD